MEELLRLVQLRGQDKDEGDDWLTLAGRCLLPPGSLSVSPLFPDFSLSSPSLSVPAARKRRRRCGRVVPPTSLPLLCFSFPLVSPQSFSSSPGSALSFFSSSPSFFFVFLLPLWSAALLLLRRCVDGADSPLLLLT